jgi:hypothetical protein
MPNTVMKLDAKQIIAEVKEKYNTEIKLEDIKNIIPKSYSVFVKDYKIALPYANGWRRIMIDELYAPRFSCAVSSINTDDPYIQRMTEQIQIQIYHIPISYFEKQYNEIDSHRFIGVIDIRNTTTEKLLVKSGDIKVQQIGRYQNILKYNDNTVICELLPSYRLKLTVGIEWGFGYTNSSFRHTGPILYRPTKFDTSVESKTLPNAASVIPTDYRLGLTGCPEPMSAIEMCLVGWKTYLEIIKQAKFALEEYEKYLNGTNDRKVNTNRLYESELLNVKNTMDGVEYIFHNQSQTLTNLLAYIIINKYNIQFVSSYKKAPYDHFVILKILDTNHLKIIFDSCNIAENEISRVINTY